MLNIKQYIKNVSLSLSQIGYLYADVRAAFKEDPALRGKVFGFLELLLYPGVWAIFFHRVSHLLFVMEVPFLPRLVSQISRFLTGIEIHPGAKIGKGFFIDHGMGVVIGETAEIGDHVLMYHQVTLGGTSLNPGKRHPTIGNNVLIGAGAKIFGAVTIGDNTQIGGSSVITKNVPPHSVVVGNPGQIIRSHGEKVVVDEVNQVNLPDPVMNKISELEKRVNVLEGVK